MMFMWIVSNFQEGTPHMLNVFNKTRYKKFYYGYPCILWKSGTSHEYKWSLAPLLQGKMFSFGAIFPTEVTSISSNLVIYVCFAQIVFTIWSSEMDLQTPNFFQNPMLLEKDSLVFADFFNLVSKLCVKWILWGDTRNVYFLKEI